MFLATNCSDPVGGVFKHSILTEKGERTFSIPVSLAESPDFFLTMNQLKSMRIDAGLGSEDIIASLRALSPIVCKFDASDLDILMQTIDSLVRFAPQSLEWYLVPILFDRIEAGCVKNIDLVAGNPPWVKWSNLPRPYAEFIKPICDRMNIFSEDVWVGGIQSDIFLSKSRDIVHWNDL
ncbi:hypothetical protein ACKXF4_15205 [Faecalibacterium prausnitzii]|uniref:hypothetical protein n=1 Tax=Faecalibacterium prausnitzii TaxID=853 RepID=UPI003AB01CD0